MGRDFNFYLTKEWKSVAREAKRLHKKEFGYSCLCCKGKFKPGQLHADHIIPIFMRPELRLDLSNIQILCGKCNVNKRGLVRDYRPDNYPTKRPEYTKVYK